MIRPTRFLDGQLTLLQPSRGYRFSIDAPLLADFVPTSRSDLLVEAGTGCGVIPLILAKRQPFARLLAVELQPRLARLARHNFAHNGEAARLQVWEGDFLQLQPDDLPRLADTVLANPPYHPVGAGLLNPLSEKAIARHELRLTLAGVFTTSTRLLTPGGSLVLILPWERRQTAFNLATEAGLGLERLQVIRSFPDSPSPRLVRIHWRLGPGAGQELPPLTLYDSPGVPGRDMRRLLTASPSPPAPHLEAS